MDIIQQATREIHEFHKFLQNWFNGAIPRSREALARFEEAWGSYPTLIISDNEVHTADSLIVPTMEQYGAFPRFSIQIGVTIVMPFANGSAVVVCYEKRHVDEYETEVRLCSATLALRADGSTVPQWIHVHESMIERIDNES